MFTPIGAVIGNAVGAVVGTVAQGIGSVVGGMFTGVGNFLGAQTGSFIGSAVANVGSAITSAGTWVGNTLGTFFKGDNQFSFGNSWNTALGKTFNGVEWVGGYSLGGLATVGVRNMLIGSTITNTLQEFGVNEDISRIGGAFITGGLTSGIGNPDITFGLNSAITSTVSTSVSMLGEDNDWGYLPTFAASTAAGQITAGALQDWNTKTVEEKFQENLEETYGETKSFESTPLDGEKFKLGTFSLGETTDFETAFESIRLEKDLNEVYFSLNDTFEKTNGFQRTRCP